MPTDVNLRLQLQLQKNTSKGCLFLLDSCCQSINSAYFKPAHTRILVVHNESCKHHCKGFIKSVIRYTVKKNSQADRLLFFPILLYSTTAQSSIGYWVGHCHNQSSTPTFSSAQPAIIVVDDSIRFIHSFIHSR